MAIFKLRSRREHDGAEVTFLYDNINSRLMTDDGRDVVQKELASAEITAFPVSRDNPGKKASPRVLKISLGLSCNYECEYCSQRFVPRSQETNKSDIDSFLDGLHAWVTYPPERIEFWGGEPLVYVKTLRPLAERLRAIYPNASFSIITNGALLNSEINEWLDRMGFSVGISHDAMGQLVRGPDPLEDEDSRAGIIDLYKRLKPSGRISINSMLHRGNQSRKAIRDFWVSRFGENVSIGEGALIDPYDAGGIASSLTDADEQIKFRKQSLNELRSGELKQFDLVKSKLQGFLYSLRSQRNAYTLGQKCSMDRADNIAVDLRGNVLTCQNVSAASIAPNGLSNKIGHVSNFSEIKLNTATHWSQRKDCPSCPVLQLCQGSCMFLEGPLWDAGCDNAYSDNIPFLVASVEYLTGFAPYYIEGDFREDRKDIFGTKRKDSGAGASGRAKAFPVPVVAG